RPTTPLRGPSRTTHRGPGSESCGACQGQTTAMAATQAPSLVCRLKVLFTCQIGRGLRTATEVSLFVATSAGWKFTESMTEMPRRCNSSHIYALFFSHRAWSSTASPRTQHFRFETAQLESNLCGAKSGKVMVMRRRLTTMQESISSTHRYQVSDNAARTSDHGFRRHARAASWIMRACIIAV